MLSVSNSGYDWGAYHAGVRFVLDTMSPDSVALMNDSVYVVPDALEAFLQRVDRVLATSSARRTA